MALFISGYLFFPFRSMIWKGQFGILSQTYHNSHSPQKGPKVPYSLDMKPFFVPFCITSYILRLYLFWEERAFGQTVLYLVLKSIIT